MPKIRSFSGPNWENTKQKKLRIWTFFTENTEQISYTEQIYVVLTIDLSEKHFKDFARILRAAWTEMFALFDSTLLET